MNRQRQRGMQRLVTLSLLTWVSIWSTGCGERGGSSSSSYQVETPMTIQDNMTVQLEYTLTVDGKVVDSSKGRGPLSYVHGQSQMIPGLEQALIGLRAGDTQHVTVSPAQGYGEVNAEAFVDVPKEQLPEGTTPEVGLVLTGMTPDGQPIRAAIHEIGEQTVTLNMNHPLAGKTLTFDVTVVSIAPPE